MRKLPPLTALRAFEAAARHQSFTLAGKELSVTTTAVSHQIRHLEDLLGIPLFERTPRSLKLTAAGERLFPVLRDGLDRFAAVVADLAAVASDRNLTVTATTAFAERWLVPRLAGFRNENPEIDLRIQATESLMDLRGDGVDVAIRYGRGVYPGYVTERLFGDRYLAVCSPALAVAAAEGGIGGLTLLHHDWKNPVLQGPTWGRWLDAVGATGVDPRKGLGFSEESHAIAAALNGQGIALCSSVLVAEDMRGGRLVAPFETSLEGFCFYLLHLESTVKRPLIDRFRAWLRTQLPGPPA